MKLTVKYFGMLAEITGKAEEQFSSDISNVEELQLLLFNMYPDLETKNCKIAVNQTLVSGIIEINENDEIALLPPFAGG